MTITSTATGSPTPLLALDAAALMRFAEAADVHTRNWLAASEFRAQAHTHVLMPRADGTLAQVLVGMREARDPYALAHLPMALPPGEYVLASAEIDSETAALGWLLGSYQFTRYKQPARVSATLVMPDSAALTRATRTYEAVKLTRDLVNTPTEDMGPQHLAEVADAIAKAHSAKRRDWAGEELLKDNFPAIHAVGRASHRPPRLIEMLWGDETHPRIAIVGKGVCFDTGGLNMKGAEGMRWMKKDMGGGAHALALAQWIMAAKLPVRLHVLVPAVENAVAGNAYRPGEVVHTRAGKTVEIGNTDAEGRVILSDALAYACESKPEVVIDFATLTGAARVALGPELPATFANDDNWFARLDTAAKSAHDPIWRMPLWQPYNAMLASTIADINNTGGAQAGAITAALFLEHFIPKGQAWLHLDTFAWNAKSRPGRPEGGEALGLRAVFAMLEKHYRAPKNQ